MRLCERVGGGHRMIPFAAMVRLVMETDVAGLVCEGDVYEGEMEVFGVVGRADPCLACDCDDDIDDDGECMLLCCVCVCVLLCLVFC